jgi:signal peptidase
MSQYAADCLPQPRRLSAGVRRAGHLADRGSSVVCGLAIALLAVLLAGTAAGYRPLIDHSDSMRPAIRAGDLILTHAAPATSIRRGDIVTFSDRALQGKLVTHRVVARHASGTRIDFVTRGDANPAPENWSVDRRASVGKLAVRVPAVGRPMAWMAGRWPRAILLSLAALVLSTALLRRIWKA